MKTAERSAEDRIRIAKEHSLEALRTAAKNGTISDENNHLFTFSGISTDLLLDFVRGEYDLDFFLRAELASRGLNIHGQWIGHKAAEKEFKL